MSTVGDVVLVSSWKYTNEWSEIGNDRRERCGARFPHENRPMSDYEIGNERRERCGVHFSFENRSVNDFQRRNECHEGCRAHFLSENRSLNDFQIGNERENGRVLDLQVGSSGKFNREANGRRTKIALLRKSIKYVFSARKLDREANGRGQKWRPKYGNENRPPRDRSLACPSVGDHFHISVISQLCRKNSGRLNWHTQIVIPNHLFGLMRKNICSYHPERLFQQFYDPVLVNGWSQNYLHCSCFVLLDCELAITVGGPFHMDCHVCAIVFDKTRSGGHFLRRGRKTVSSRSSGSLRSRFGRWACSSRWRRYVSFWKGLQQILISAITKRIRPRVRKCSGSRIESKSIQVYRMQKA